MREFTLGLFFCYSPPPTSGHEDAITTWRIHLLVILGMDFRAVLRPFTHVCQESFTCPVSPFSIHMMILRETGCALLILVKPFSFVTDLC